MVFSRGADAEYVIGAKDDTGQAFDSFEGKLSKAKVAGVAAGAAIAAGAVAVSAASVKMATDFEKSLREVNTLLGGSQKEFKDLEGDVLSFSKRMGISAKTTVPALYQAISAGVPRQNVFEFMEVAAKTAIGGVTDLETAVDGLTSVVNAYGRDNLDVSDAADVLFTTVRLGKTTIEELSAAMFNVVPIAAATGVEFEQVAAGMSALTAQGVPTAQATTQLRAAIQSLTAPTKRQAALMQELGFEMNAARLQELGLAGAFKEVIAAAGGDLQVLRQLIGSVEAIQAVLALGGEQSAVFEDHLRQMEEAAGSTDAAFEEMQKSTARLWESMTATGERILIQFGTALLPTVNEQLTAFSDWVAQHEGSIVGAFNAMATAIGLVATAAGEVVSSVSDIVGVIASPFIWTVQFLHMVNDQVTGDGSADGGGYLTPGAAAQASIREQASDPRLWQLVNRGAQEWFAKNMAEDAPVFDAAFLDNLTGQAVEDWMSLIERGAAPGMTPDSNAGATFTFTPSGQPGQGEVMDMFAAALEPGAGGGDRFDIGLGPKTNAQRMAMQTTVLLGGGPEGLGLDGLQSLFREWDSLWGEQVARAREQGIVLTDVDRASWESRRLSAWKGAEDVADATDEIDEVTQRYTAQLADAWIRGGATAVAETRATQAQLGTAWKKAVADAAASGVKLTDEHREAWERMWLDRRELEAEHSEELRTSALDHWLQMQGAAGLVWDGMTLDTTASLERIKEMARQTFGDTLPDEWQSMIDTMVQSAEEGAKALVDAFRNSLEGIGDDLFVDRFAMGGADVEATLRSAGIAEANIGERAAALAAQSGLTLDVALRAIRALDASRLQRGEEFLDDRTFYRFQEAIRLGLDISVGDAITHGFAGLTEIVGNELRNPGAVGADSVSVAAEDPWERTAQEFREAVEDLTVTFDGVSFSIEIGGREFTEAVIEATHDAEDHGF